MKNTRLDAKVPPKIRYDEFVHGMDALHKAALSGYFQRSSKDNQDRARTRGEWTELLARELKRPIA